VRSFASVVAVNGTAGNDTLSGSAFGDVITGGVGNDLINGGAGTDTAVYAGNLADYRLDHISATTIRVTDLRTGQDGIDDLVDVEYVQFADGAHWLASLVPQSLTLTGTAGNDTLTGSTYDDILTGAGGNDTLIGGGGRDTAVYSGNLADYTLERISGTTVRITDLRAGQNGIDLLTNITSLQFADGVRAMSSLVPSGITLVGTAGNDTLTGTTGADVLNGFAGNDTLYGGGDADLIYGGDGDDSLFGDPQGQFFNGAANFYGGAGNDRITPGSRYGIVDGGAGTDTVAFTSVSGTINVTDANFVDIEAFSVTGYHVVFNASTIQTGLTISTDLTGNNTINGTIGDDIVTATGGNNSLSGGGGNDRLTGGVDSDVLFGGDGEDWLMGGLGTNTYFGGAGHDRFVCTVSAGGIDAFADFVGGEDLVDLSGQGLSFAQLTVQADGSGSDVTVNGYTLFFRIAPGNITADMFVF
jgi:Ca2+-binding RTX toxin-like protein